MKGIFFDMYLKGIENINTYFFVKFQKTSKNYIEQLVF